MYAEVKAVETLSPAMVRIVFGGGELADFEMVEATDAHINARFIPVGSPVQVPFDPDDLDDVAPEMRPRPRRFTVRRWDPARVELTIDFVAHGDVGYAGSWAQRAEPGDRLQFTGPSGSYRPGNELDWHLFAGDESALPAIGASLESLQAGKRAEVIVVVDDASSEIDLPTAGDVRITWVHRAGADDIEAVLPDAVARHDFPTGSYDVFVHGEAAEVRAIRKHLLSCRDIEPDLVSLSPYWRRSLTDEAWRAIKNDWIAEQANDF